MSQDELSPLEELVLLSLPRLGEEAYGMTIRQAIEERSGRVASIAAVYAALRRLEERGLVSAWHTDPTPERGGRARRHFRISKAGAGAVWRAREQVERMWDGVKDHPELERGS